MNTIKYLQVFSITILIIVITALSWKLRLTYKECYDESESVDKGYGLPLSALKTITFGKNTSYREIDEDEIKQLTSLLVDVVFWSKVGEPVQNLDIDDKELLSKLSKKLVDTFNKKLEQNDKPFNVIRDNIVSKNNTASNEYLISSKHIIYREGKMYGFVLNIQSLWTNPDLELKGFTSVNPSGIIMEDDIFMIKNENQSNYREYGDSLSFIQSEAIMKDNSYENEVSQKQAYGLLQDRGISSKSFSSS